MRRVDILLAGELGGRRQGHRRGLGDGAEVEILVSLKLAVRDGALHGGDTDTADFLAVDLHVEIGLFLDAVGFASGEGDDAGLGVERQDGGLWRINHEGGSD